MLKNFLLSSIIMTSSLTILSSAQAMFEEEKKENSTIRHPDLERVTIKEEGNLKTLSISCKKLKEDYNWMSTKWYAAIDGDPYSYLSITTNSKAPDFDHVPSEHMFLVESPHNAFHILLVGNSSIESKYNDQTRLYETHYKPGCILLDLTVRCRPRKIFKPWPDGSHSYLYGHIMDSAYAPRPSRLSFRHLEEGVEPKEGYNY